MTYNTDNPVYLAKIGSDSTTGCGPASGFGTNLVGGNIFYTDGSQVNGIQLFYSDDAPSVVTLGSATGTSLAT